MIALLVIALGNCQIRPYRNAPVPWQEPAQDLSFIDPVSVPLNGSVLDRSFDSVRLRRPPLPRNGGVSVGTNLAIAQGDHKQGDHKDRPYAISILPGA